VIFGREYQMLSPKGEILLNASSRWCLIDVESGKLLQSKAIDNQDYSTYNTSKVMENVKWKIPTFRTEEGDLKFSLKIANSEYDHNMHVNNARYADYCFNCFSVAELAEKRLQSFSITYVKQCKENENLYFYLKRAEDKGYLVHGFNEQDELVVQSHIVFEE
jgi:acyl-ACP thioesterase